MKKFLSLLLAAMMLLSCATAMAESTGTQSDKVDSIVNGNSSAWADNGAQADIDVRVENARYGDDAKFDTKGEAATEIWLQVDATGQIDVTVPLVLVFQTNIDGGHAISPEAYKITNNSTADLVVTNIKTTLVATNADNQPMTMEAYGESNTFAAGKEDYYAARITGISGTMGKQMAGPFDLFTSVTTAHHNDAVKGGLFELAQKSTNNPTGVTNLKVEMKTSPLSFVTSRDYTENSDTSSMTNTKGIQLLTITYTVAIDTSDAIGEEITDTAEEGTAPFTGTTDAGKIVEKEVSGASDDGRD